VIVPPRDRHRRASRRLARIPGVVGVGCGLKETAGVSTDQPCWRVYVREKRPARTLSAAARIPGQLLGWPTDVIARAPARAAAGETMPIVADGALIANSQGVPGTLGCRAWVQRTGQPLLLSSHHVLFGKNAQRGDRVWHVCPGTAAHRYHPIARNLEGRAETIRYDGQPYFVDAAVAALDPLRAAESSAAPGRPAAATLGQLVIKHGAATGRTIGRIVDICYPDRWFAHELSLDAPNQLLIAPADAPPRDATRAPSQAASDPPPVFCQTGDSGSVVRDDTDAVVGLLWGSNARGEGVACHIGPVLHALRIGLAPPWSSAGEA
jgi:hypothetical protein